MQIFTLGFIKMAADDKVSCCRLDNLISFYSRVLARFLKQEGNQNGGPDPTLWSVSRHF